jgi:thiamine-monophosphate kinase
MHENRLKPLKTQTNKTPKPLTTKSQSAASRRGPTIKAPGELALIAAVRARKQARNPAVHLGIGDDCALIWPGIGEEIAITTDFSLENVHFRRDWHPPESVGRRCLARGLSDLAAMGARPLAAFLSLAVPAELTIGQAKQKSWLQRFLDGFLALAEQNKVTLAGGDTAQSPAIGGQALVAADIVLIGAVKRGHALLRSSAKPGDRIYVTGELGGAAAELLALQRNPLKFSKLKFAAPNHPHLYPEPQVQVGRKLAAQKLATACIDISDGLSTDLRHLCEEAHLSAEIGASRIPIHPMAQLAQIAGWTKSALDLALHGGEDYELLFTASSHAKIPSTIANIPITSIGTMVKRRKGRASIQIGYDGESLQPLEAKGWEHFRK